MIGERRFTPTPLNNEGRSPRAAALSGACVQPHDSVKGGNHGEESGYGPLSRHSCRPWHPSTGMRRGELLALRWRAVDLDRRELKVEAETEKTGRGRVIPLTDALYEELSEMKGRRPRPAFDSSDPVFTARDGEPLTEKMVRLGFKRAVQHCEAVPLEKRDKVDATCAGRWPTIIPTTRDRASRRTAACAGASRPTP